LYTEQYSSEIFNKAQTYQNWIHVLIGFSWRTHLYLHKFNPVLGGYSLWSTNAIHTQSGSPILDCNSWTNFRWLDSYQNVLLLASGLKTKCIKSKFTTHEFCRNNMHCCYLPEV
jgi:hypothetical protein